MKLSIVIVNYNVRYYLDQCLRSVQRAMQGLDAEVFVVDNHSSDGSVEHVRTTFPWVHLIASPHNNGFARANNIAIRQSQAEYVLLLNPDTLIGETVLAESITFMDAHPDAGGLGVHMMNGDGSDARESRRAIPTPLVSFYKMTGLCARFPQSRRFGKYYMGYLPWHEAAPIEVISGAYCLLRRSALDQVGLLDEDFFMYGEDIDLSCRILKGGYSNWYLPVRILHYKGESTHKSSFRYVHVFYEAMLIFFRKHYGHLSHLLAVPIKTAIYLKATWALVGMLSDRARKSLGFFSPRQQQDVEYVIIGRNGNVEACRHILSERGFDTACYEGDAQTMPLGHHDPRISSQIQTGKNQPTVVVYDATAYRYDQILALFARAPQSHILMGTYLPETQRIITPKEIIQ